MIICLLFFLCKKNRRVDITYLYKITKTIYIGSTYAIYKGNNL
jgi:hypothetical protein